MTANVFPSAGEQLLDGAIPVVSQKSAGFRGSSVTIDVDGNVTLPSGADLILPTGGSIVGLVMTNATIYYIDSVLGSDSTGTGLTSGSPVASFAKLWTLVPKLLAAPLNIQMLSAGNYPWSAMPAFVQLTDSARIVFTAADNTRVLVATGVCGGGTDASKIVGDAVLTLNQYQHAHLTITSGPASGFRRTIMSNTASATPDIIPASRYENLAGVATAVTPVAGDTYEVHNPGVVITGISTVVATMFSNIGAGDAYAPLILHNLRLDGMDAVEIANCTIYGYGIHLGGTAGAPVFTNCRGAFGRWDHRNKYFTTVPLPTSTAASTVKAGWLADLGLATDVEALARYRGWGLSQPSYTSLNLTTPVAQAVRVTACSMSIDFTGSSVRAIDSNLLIGGIFWNYLTFAGGVAGITGRGDYDANIVDSTVVGGLITEGAANVIAGSPTRSLGVSNPRGNSTLTFWQNSCAFDNGILVGGLAVLDFLSGSSGHTMNNNSASSGTLRVTEGGSVRGLHGVTVTNANASGPALVMDGRAEIGSTGGNCTFVGGGGTLGAVRVSGRARINQSGGILTVTASAGPAVRALKGAKLALRGSTNTVLTGSAGNPGLHCEFGAQAFVDGALTSITDAGSTATGLKVGNAAASDSAALAAAYAAITDTYGSVIGRAA